VVAGIHAARARYLADLAREHVEALGALGAETLGDTWVHALAAARSRHQAVAIAQLAREVARCARTARRLDAERMALAAKLG